MKKLIARILLALVNEAELARARTDRLITQCNRELVQAGCTPMDAQMEAALRAPRDTRLDTVVVDTLPPLPVVSQTRDTVR